MKILFIAPSLPVNNSSGGSIRSYQLYQELKSFAKVDVVTANSVGVSFPLLRTFKEENNHVGHVIICWKDYFFGIQNRLMQELKDIINQGNYDYVFIRYYNTAYRLGALKLQNLILDCDDCYLELLNQNSSTEGLGYFDRLKCSISKHFRKINYVKNINALKRVAFSKVSKETPWEDNYSLIPNKISLGKNINHCPSSSKEQASATVLFIGVLNYAPNYEGIDHFICNIWPLVTERCPKAKLKIVGGGLSAHLKSKWAHFPNIEICGFVENIESAYADVDLAVAPVYKGSGTHIKVMESLLRSKTMVISQLAHRGYENTLLDGESLFVASSDCDYANKLVRLIINKPLRDKFSLHGFDAVVRHHAIETSPSMLKKFFTEATHHPTTLPVSKVSYENVC